MKLRGAKTVHYESGPNMTPLVDVVMVILIFLMLAGSFAGAEHYLQSNQAISTKGASGESKPGEIPDEPLEIRVDSPSPDRYVARAGQISVGDQASLIAQLTKVRQQMNAAGTSTDKILVVINPGKQVKYRFLIEAYEAALGAEFTKVGFATAHD
jgi:biopolymer transport protein ExbD